MKSLFKISMGWVVCALTAGIFWTSSATPQLTSRTQTAVDAAAAPLRDGHIWITGGVGSAGALASVNLLDKDGSSWPVAPMILARSKHAAVVLNDGRLLVAGGDTGSGATNETEIYDPASNRWKVGPPMIASRSGHTASLLIDGRVLIAGGAGAGAPGITLEIFDPRNGGFSLAGTLEISRQNHATAVLSDGRVLIVGGLSGDRVLASSEIYDPGSGSISNGPSLSTGRAKATATTLRDGRVLVAGGSNELADLASTEIYDAVTNSFSPGPALGESRSGHNAFLLPDDSILIQGGTRARVELYAAPLTKSLPRRALENGLVGADTPASLTGVDLSTYVRVGRFNLPEPTRTTPPPNSLLAQEASAVTYNPDTDTLFVVGDGGRSIVQVTKTGQLIDSMTLALGSSPQGTDFYDTEGLTYVGGGKFVVTEERDRQANLFTYAAGSTLSHAGAQTVKLGTTIGNIGIEGISYDPQTSGATPGFIIVKETQPEGIFQTNIDFAAGTATNGSPTTVNSTNLFDPALMGLSDLSDVFALSNLSSLSGPDKSHLLVLSQEAGKIVNVDRSGNVFSSLTIATDPGNPLPVADQQHEGLTMDNNGRLYVVNENGGGDTDHPQLWVYAPSLVPNEAPTAVVLNSQMTSIPENTSTAARIKVADIAIVDDGLGTNNVSLTGPDAPFFEVDSSVLYLKAGTNLDFETKTSYSLTVNINDPTVGANPDATAPYTLAVTDVANETPTQPALFISEVSPSSSGNSPYAQDWFELTNTGSSAVNISGWKMDDNSNVFANAVALAGVSSINPGQSVVFVETTNATPADVVSSFKTAWFGANVPIGFTIGTYTGSGVGLSTSGDAVNIFDGSGNRITGIGFGTSTAGFTFDNTAGLGSTTLPLPVISTLSVAGINGALLAPDNETGSPGTIRHVPIISEVSPSSSGNSTYAQDWFEVTNPGAFPLDISGWKMDDNSNVFANAVALSGVTSIPPRQSVVFVETASGTAAAAATIAAFKSSWFGSNVPVGFTIGTYTGNGVGLSTGADAVNLFDALGNRVAGVAFNASTTGLTFDNKAGVGGTTLPLPFISTLSVVGVNGAFASPHDETGSPGRLANQEPTVALNNQVTTIAENTSTATRIKVADIAVTDDGVGANLLNLAGSDASFFELVGSALYLRANTILDFETKTSYAVSVSVDDPTVSGTPDASVGMTLAVTNVIEESYFLHGTGTTADPAMLFLNTTAPTGSTSKYKDSGGVTFTGGNLWKEIGVWGGANPRGTFSASSFRTWIGLKNSDDQGTRFDLRVEVYKNALLVASGETYCVQDVTRNANSAVATVLTLSGLSGVPFTDSDQLSVRALTRIGTTAGAFCGGHSNATGLRLYFDAAATASKLFPN